MLGPRSRKIQLLHPNFLVCGQHFSFGSSGGTPRFRFPARRVLLVIFSADDLVLFRLPLLGGCREVQTKLNLRHALLYRLSIIAAIMRDIFVEHPSFCRKNVEDHDIYLLTCTPVFHRPVGRLSFPPDNCRKCSTTIAFKHIVVCRHSIEHDVTSWLLNRFGLALATIANVQHHI